MSDIRHSAAARPWLAPLLGAAAALAMLLVPFSYQKTVAYDVSFHLDGRSAPLASGLSSALQESFGATSINSNSDGDGRLTLTARVPLEAANGVAARAEAFASVLRADGQTVTTTVEPVRETVSGNLFAMTRDQTVRVDITATGRTPAEIEADVRRQLEAAGVTGANVMVSQDDGKTTIQIFQEHEGDKAAGNGGDGVHVIPGQEGEGAGWVSDSRQDPAAHGNFEFTIDGKTPDPAKMATVKIDNNGQKLSDADLKRSIEDQLRAQGHPADVVVSDGKVVSITPIRN
ncbi:MAG: hypothetical protein FD129_614 [bacterium]|nr:MAG: hypothetical protein FD129_614 [bacterium]